MQQQLDSEREHRLQVQRQLSPAAGVSQPQEAASRAAASADGVMQTGTEAQAPVPAVALQEPCESEKWT